MEWKYEAIDKLKKYEAKKSSLQSIPREIRTLDMQMQNIRSAAADGTPAPGCDPGADTHGPSPERGPAGGNQ